MHAVDDTVSYVSEEEKDQTLSRRVTFAPTPLLAVPFGGDTGMCVCERELCFRENTVLDRASLVEIVRTGVLCVFLSIYVVLLL